MTGPGAGRQLSLVEPAAYTIEVQGTLDDSWLEWTSALEFTVTNRGGGNPVTVINGKMDQAALLGLLRRLYGFGLPLISVDCVDIDKNLV